MRWSDRMQQLWEIDHAALDAGLPIQKGIDVARQLGVSRGYITIIRAQIAMFDEQYHDREPNLHVKEWKAWLAQNVRNVLPMLIRAASNASKVHHPQPSMPVPIRKIKQYRPDRASIMRRFEAGYYGPRDVLPPPKPRPPRLPPTQYARTPSWMDRPYMPIEDQEQARMTAKTLHWTDVVYKSGTDIIVSIRKPR
jgi:hypothetical protein